MVFETGLYLDMQVGHLSGKYVDLDYRALQRFHRAVMQSCRCANLEIGSILNAGKFHAIAKQRRRFCITAREVWLSVEDNRAGLFLRA
jgi:hypothetical protein